MKKLTILLALLLVFSLALAACGPAETEAPPEEPAVEEPEEEELPFAGETVTVFTPAGDEQARVFELRSVR